mgnify:CR=1 FL=1
MEILLVYSNKCKNCVKLKKYSVFDNIKKLNIDNKLNLKNIPPYINSVPSLIITKNDDINVLKNTDLLNWFKMNSNDNDKIYNKSNIPRNLQPRPETQNTQQNIQPQQTETVQESNMLTNTDFSSPYSFIEGGGDDISQNL